MGSPHILFRAAYILGKGTAHPAELRGAAERQIKERMLYAGPD